MSEFERELQRLSDLLDNYINDFSNFNNINKYISKNMFLILKKTIQQELNKEQSKWVVEVRKRLSDKWSVKNKDLRKPRSRLFPYMNEGYLRDALQQKVNVKFASDSIIIESIIGFTKNKLGERHAILTNEGFHTRQDASWIGWMDDLFEGDGRANIPSVVGMLEKFFNYNNLQTIVEKSLRG